MSAERPGVTELVKIELGAAAGAGVLFVFAALMTAPLGDQADALGTRIVAALALASAVGLLAAGPLVAWRGGRGRTWGLVAAAFMCLGLAAGGWALAGGLSQ